MTATAHAGASLTELFARPRQPLHEILRLMGRMPEDLKTVAAIDQHAQDGSETLLFGIEAIGQLMAADDADFDKCALGGLIEHLAGEVLMFQEIRRACWDARNEK